MNETSGGASSDSGSKQASGLDGRTISALLWSGLYLWEVVRSVPFDWKVLVGKRACRWGACFFYFPMRGLAAVFFACTIALTFPPPWQPSNVLTLRYVCESTYMISKLFVYHILAIQVAMLWRSWKVSWPIMASIMGFWTFTLYGISRVHSPWYNRVVPKTFSSLSLATSFLTLALYALGLLRARSRSRRASSGNASAARYAHPSIWSLLSQERLQFVLLVWVAQVINTAFDLADASFQAKITALITTYIIIIVCGSRAYQHMAARSGVCPMTSVPCMLTSAVRMSKKWNSTSSATSSSCTGTETEHRAAADDRTRRRSAPQARRAGDGDIRVATDAIELHALGSENFSPTSDVLSAKALSMSTSPSDDHAHLDGKSKFPPIAPG